MYNNNKKTSSEIWAILDRDGNVMWSRGGSSSTPKLLTFDSPKKAIASLSNYWTRQSIADGEGLVEKIYTNTK